MLVWKPIIAAVIIALTTDLDAFLKAREKDPTVRFDIGIVLVRVVKALLLALATIYALPGIQ